MKEGLIPFNSKHLKVGCICVNKDDTISYSYVGSVSSIESIGRTITYFIFNREDGMGLVMVDTVGVLMNTTALERLYMTKMCYVDVFLSDMSGLPFSVTTSSLKLRDHERSRNHLLLKSYSFPIDLPVFIYHQRLVYERNICDYV